MTTSDLLTLTQWLSPAFPLGAFAYSHGLEAAIAAGEVHDAATLKDWLTLVLDRGAGRADATLLCAALRGQEAAPLADLARALAASKERLEETEAQGRAFVATVNGITGGALSPMPLPVAVGVAARGLALAPGQVAALYLHAFASNLTSAAVRFVPLGQTEGQATLAALHGLIDRVAQEAARADPDQITSAAFGADMAAMRHETLEVRLFKS